MKRKWLTGALIAVVSFASGGWFVQSTLSQEGERLKQARLFESVLGLVRDYYVDSIPEPELYRQAAYGLVDELQDPYSALLIGEDFDRADERTTGDYGGIGARVDVRNGWITIVSTMPNTPAERAGILTGDRIVAIDGVSTEGWSLPKAIGTLRGEQGSMVELRIARDGRGAPLDVPLQRDRVHQLAVPRGVLLDSGIGYLSMDAVRSNSANELAAEVGRLYASGMKGLVLDLRGNPGGIRDEAVAAADLFLDPGAEILVTQGRTAEDNLRFVDSTAQPWPDLPIVVVVNQGSASAAEIIAGALQDHDRAVVLGQPTFGKGLVQTQFRFGRDVALRITTARWFTPSGRTIQRPTTDIPHHEGGDSAARPIFFSASGRPLPGGGGIVPDRAVAPDTLTDAERRLAQAVEPHLGAYRDALVATALEVKRRGGEVDRNAAFTALLGRFSSGGLHLQDSVIAGATGLLQDQLDYEIARYLRGPTGELTRRLADDRQIAEALTLLTRSRTTAELFKLAGSPLSPGAGPG